MKVNDQLMAKLSGSILDLDDDVDVETENQDSNKGDNLENDDDNQDDNESVRSVDEYSDYEKVAAFYENAMKNKSMRTNPQFEAEVPKTSNGGREPIIKCNTCEFKAKNKAQLNGHIKEKHMS